MRIKKIYNNNIVCVMDREGNECIASGRGIGFQKHAGDMIDRTHVSKLYRLVTEKGNDPGTDRKEQFSKEILSLTETMMVQITKELNIPKSDALFYMLAEHIRNLIERKPKGNLLKPSMTQAVMDCYPTEYALGRQCLNLIEETYQIRQDPEDAVLFALMIIIFCFHTDFSA